MIHMELSERYIKQLEDEGYNPVYEHYDEPNTSYPAHSHKEQHAIIIVEGSMKVMVDVEMKTLHVNDKIILSPNEEHSVLIGPKGCKYVVGEK